MPSIQLYNTLLKLPLFQGMSKSDLSNIIGHTKFGFVKVENGKTVIKEDTPCTHLYFLINGVLQVEGYADNHSYTFIENLNAPNIIQIERLFGLTQRYTRTFTAVTDSNFIVIEKNEVMKLNTEYIIFRLNFINMLCTQTQKITHHPWRKQPVDLRHRIIRFIENRCLRPVGEKKILIHMETLAEEINDSRLNVSKILNMMQDEGLIELHRGGIHIPALEKLLI